MFLNFYKYHKILSQILVLNECMLFDLDLIHVTGGIWLESSFRALSICPSAKFC